MWLSNCPICKNAVTNSQYWPHVRSHPGHGNDSPPLRREPAENKEGEYSKSYSGGGDSASRSFNRGKSSPLAPKLVEVGNKYDQTLPKSVYKGMELQRCKGLWYLLRMEKEDKKLRSRLSRQETDLLEQQCGLIYTMLIQQQCDNHNNNRNDLTP